MATVYSDRGLGVRGAGGLLQPLERSRGAFETGRFRLAGHLRGRRALEKNRLYILDLDRAFMALGMTDYTGM